MIPAQRDEVLKMLKTDNWVEAMTTPQLEILARLHPDLTEVHKVDEFGRRRTELKPECRHRYKLYKLLRSKRRVGKKRHAEKMLSTKE